MDAGRRGFARRRFCRLMGDAEFFKGFGPDEVLMFDSLSDRLSGVFDKLRGRGALTEDDVRAAMREVA